MPEIGMLAGMDPVSMIVLTLVLLVVASWVVLYFVIKAAMKNALIEDRAFQAKVAKMRQENATK